MSSINFNSAATQALRTLQTSNSQLDATQKRIATGLAIGEAKDNAAYWSISTTMQSDNKALGTVTDALGLGAATVDTAYQGLSAAKDVLNEIKSKLTAALGSNVDRTAIQSEITSLQDQLKSIASSSTFSGENWLAVNSSLASYSADKTVVSSFTRNVSGSVTVGEIAIDTRGAVLFDANTTSATKGILDSTNALTVNVGGVTTSLGFGGTGVSGNTSKAGLANVAAVDANYTAGTGVAGAAAAVLVGAGSFSAGGLKIGDNVSFDVSLDGGASTNTVTLKITADNKSSAANFRTALQGAIDNVGALNGKVTVGSTGGDVVLNTVSQGTDAKIRVGTITATDTTTSVLGLTAAAATGATAASGAAPEFTLGTYNVANGATGDKIRLSVTLGSSGGTAFTNIEVTLTAAMLDATSGAAAFAAELNTQLDAATAGKLNTSSTAGVIKIVGAANRASGSSTDDDVIVLNAAATAVNASTTVGALTGVTTTGTSGVDQTGTGTTAKVTFDTFTAVTLDADDSLNLTFAGSAFSVTKAKIDLALGGSDGKIGSVDQFVTVLNSLAGKNFTASKDNNGKLVLASDASGTSASAVVTATGATQGTMAGGAGISVANIDVTDVTLNTLGATDADKRVQAITAYINVVNGAINKVTAAATSIGSVAKRIDLQKTFVQNLMDTIEKGISGLVDADMNEESTKLQALQVKQQLGVQALSIANQSAQNVLRLFQ